MTSVALSFSTPFQAGLPINAFTREEQAPPMFVRAQDTLYVEFIELA